MFAQSLISQSGLWPRHQTRICHMFPLLAVKSDGRSLLIGSLSNLDNRRQWQSQKINNWFYEQNNTGSERESPFLVHFFDVHCATVRRKTARNASFYGGREYTMTTCPFSFWTGIKSFQKNSTRSLKNRPFMTNWGGSKIDAIKFERTQDDFFIDWTLHCRRPRRCLNSLE